MLLATVGAGLAAAAALVMVLVTQARHDPGSAREDNGNEAAGHSSSGTFVQESPWRLRVSGVDVIGCDVVLTNENSDNVRKWNDVYGIKTFQMRESGTFRYQVNDSRCGVLPQQGDGGLSRLPFSWSPLNGDTPVFESPGVVTVSVESRHGAPTCDLWLMSDSDGRPIDNREAAESQTSVRLESNGPGRVYIAATGCSIKVSATP
jgi:hypothetical protein